MSECDRNCGEYQYGECPGTNGPCIMEKPDQRSKETEAHMSLQQLKEADGTLVIWPADRKDNLLFRHCTNGSMIVETKNFEEDFWPLLKAHGVISYSIKTL